jgi:hypothetical protein
VLEERRHVTRALRNAEEGLQTNLNLATLGRAFAGGINDSTGFPRWLDANLFHGATFGQFRATCATASRNIRWRMPLRHLLRCRWHSRRS